MVRRPNGSCWYRAWVESLDDERVGLKKGTVCVPDRGENLDEEEEPKKCKYIQDGVEGTSLRSERNDI